MLVAGGIARRDGCRVKLMVGDRSTHTKSLKGIDMSELGRVLVTHLRPEELCEAVKALQKGVRSGTVGDLAQTAVIDAEAPRSDSEGEEDEPALS